MIPVSISPSQNQIPQVHPAPQDPPVPDPHAPHLSSSGFEECYASPKHPYTSPGIYYHDGRESRSKASVRDEGSSREPDGFVNEDLRTILATTIEIPKTDPLHRLLTDYHNLDKDVFAILHNAKINCIELPKFCNRQSEFSPEPLSSLDLTVLITASRSSINCDWLDTARILRVFLMVKGFKNINVEIAHPDAFKLVSMYPIETSNALVCLWPQVATAIQQALRPRGGITKITCFRIGKSPVPAENPVAVFVGTGRAVATGGASERES
ncbi:hypothetical protein BJY01DRAFT_145878 [Aspergillus pseudoustus]|uniref:Uncharacterized protein n=1 Tax=Aspergillus pseudoustus TaxID=1810923 RepID=A0ABR4KAL6_9EURO